MASRYKHGLSKTPEYGAWSGMRRRCLDPDHPHYRYYGGRGVTVCDRWLDDIQAFMADMGNRPDGHWLERVDSSGPYSPENCRWAPRQLIEINGEAKPLSEWCGIYDADISMAYKRIARGWDPVRALTTPSAYYARQSTHSQEPDND